MTKHEILIGNEWYEVSSVVADKLRTHNVVDVREVDEVDRHAESIAKFKKFLETVTDEEWNEINESVENALKDDLEHETIDEVGDVDADFSLENAAAVSIKLFGNPDNPLPNLHHLKKEVEETINNPKDISEYADMMILLAGAYKRADIGNFDDLFREMDKKVRINMYRKWSEPDENGVRQHLD